MSTCSCACRQDMSFSHRYVYSSSLTTHVGTNSFNIIIASCEVAEISSAVTAVAIATLQAPTSSDRKPKNAVAIASSSAYISNESIYDLILMHRDCSYSSYHPDSG